MKKVGAGKTALDSDHALVRLFEANRRWAQRIESAEPGFFEKLAHLQVPEYLWIGCSDSRVPANEIVDLWLRHVQDAWQRGQELTVHGWIYGLRDGLMRNLGMTVGQADDVETGYTAALNTLF